MSLAAQVAAGFAAVAEAINARPKAELWDGDSWEPVAAPKIQVDPDGTGYATRSTTPGDVYLGPTPVTALTPTTGTVDLDLDSVDGNYLTHSITGNVTYTSSNRANGRNVTIRIVNGATSRTLTFPAWVFVGAAAPTSIAASKTAILTITWFGTADTDAIAAYAVQP